MTTTPIHTYETVEGTEPVAHGKHEPRTTTHTVTAGNDTDLYMMTEIGDGVFVQWGECRRCSNRVAGCKCPEGPQEPPYMQPWRDARFARSLNTRPDPTYELLDSVIEWVKGKGYDVTKTVEQQLTEATPYDPDAIAIPDLTDQERDDLMDALDPLDKQARASIEASGFKTKADVEEAMAGDIKALQDPLVQRMLTMLPEDEPEEIEAKTKPPHLPPRYLDREVEDLNLPGEVDSGLDEALEKVRAAKQRDLSSLPDEF